MARPYVWHGVGRLPFRGDRSSAACFIDPRLVPGEARSRGPGLSLSHLLPTVRGVAHSWPAGSPAPLGGGGPRRVCSARSSGALLTRHVGVDQEVRVMAG